MCSHESSPILTYKVCPRVVFAAILVNQSQEGCIVERLAMM